MSPIPSTAGSAQGRRQPSSHPLAHIFNLIPPAQLVHPAQCFCFPLHCVSPAGQAWPWSVTGISGQCASVLPWHKMGWESEDGAASAPNAVTVQGSQGHNLLSVLEPQPGPVWSVPNPGMGFICKEWRSVRSGEAKSCVLFASQHREWECLQQTVPSCCRQRAWHPCSCHLCQGSARCPTCSVSGRSPAAGEAPFLCVMPGRFAIPLPFIWRIWRRPAPNLQPNASSTQAGDAFLPRIPRTANIH